MCLAVPGKVVETYREADLLMGRIDFSGISKRACLEFVPHVQVGEYVIIHAGFALSAIDEAEAARIFEYLRQMKELDELNSA